jgi:cytidylate kinase
LNSFSKFKVIAIDGPAGSGKSTTARLVAKKLGFLYLDTGAMYRALTYKVLQAGVNPRSASPVLSLLRKIKITVKSQQGSCRIFLNGREVTSRLRSKAVERNVSEVSKHSAVRRKMVKLQREIARRGNLVIEGRDTATVVFPDADLKIFLQAELEERAKRRIKRKDKFELGKQELARRDRIDSTRKVAPLKRAKGSMLIDTTRLTIPQQIQKVLRLYFLKVGKK